jgi:hypothetical protein
MYHRLDVRHSDDVEKKKFLEERLKSQVPAVMEAELTNKPDWTGSETPLVAEFDVKIPGWASNAGRRTLLPAGIFTASEKHIFEHTSRLHAIYVEYPFEKIDDVTIELPEGWQVSSMPPPHDPSKDVKIVSYALNVEKAKDSLHLTRTLKVNFLILESKYYSALRNFFQSVRTADEEQIVLQTAAATASN